MANNGIRRDLERYRGNRFRVEDRPAWTVKRKVMNIERRPGEPVSVLLMDRQVHAPSNSRYTRIVRRLETHQAVQELGTIELSFDPAIQQLVIHGISIFRAGALANHADEAAFELFQREAGLERDIINGSITTLLVLKDLRVGDVLDVEFTIVSDSALFGEHYWISEIIGNTYPIGRQWLSWIEREGQTLFVNASSQNGTYAREESEHGMVRTWGFEHTPAVALENDLPVTSKPFPEISITTFGTWSDVSSLFLQPWSVEPGDAAALQAELASLRQHLATGPAEAITAAVDLVRHHVRYLGYSPGVFALVPADPAQVWDRRFGDCKEKSRLLCWLLRELGFEADPVLVNTVGGASLEGMQTSPGAFDHVIVRLRHAGAELWIDPTDVARRGQVTSWLSLPFQFGLPLVAGSDRLVTIPAEAKGSSGLEVEETVMVDSRTRGANLTVTHTYRGTDADQMRHAMDSRGRTVVANYLTEQVKQTRADAVITGELEVEDDPRKNLFTLRCTFRCEDLLKPAQEGSADLFFLVPYSIPQWIAGVSPTRTQPLALRHPIDVKHTIRVNSEEPRKAAVPKQLVASDFFWFSFVTTTSRSESVHVFTYQSTAAFVPAAKIRNYAADLTKVSEALGWQIRFTPRGRKLFKMRPSESPDAW